MFREGSTPESVHRCVAMVHVENVDASAEFYRLLGFKIESRYTLSDGTSNFVGLKSSQAELFLARSSGPIVPSQQAVLFYMYTSNVQAMREQLIAQGIADGGIPPGARKPGQEDLVLERCAVFSISHPFYMPHGELRIHDLDGYVLLVGQLAP